METRGHLLDANEEQLKTLISQACSPVESPPFVREEIQACDGRVCRYLP